MSLIQKTSWALAAVLAVFAAPGAQAQEQVEKAEEKAVSELTVTFSGEQDGAPKTDTDKQAAQSQLSAKVDVPNPSGQEEGPQQ